MNILLIDDDEWVRDSMNLFFETEGCHLMALETAEDALKALYLQGYTRHLFSAILAAAGLAPTIFVGRGAHLVLPRDRVPAIRFICSREYRVKRLFQILKVKAEEADSKLDQIDKGQRDFFKKAGCIPL